jgi:ADP-ribose pyrophosphatase
MKYIKSLEYLWALISSQPRIDAQSAPEIVYRNDWFSVECVSYPDALEKSWSLYTVVCRDWVNIVPVTPERDVVLLVEYKYGVGRWLLGLPGGLIDEGGTPEQAAFRQLREECGLVASDIIALGKVPANPATHRNHGHFYLAKADPRTSSPVQHEPNERIFTVAVPLDLIYRYSLSSSCQFSAYDTASILRAHHRLSKDEIVE